MLGFSMSDSFVGQLAMFLAAGCGLLALFLKERGIIKSIAFIAVLGASVLTLSACKIADVDRGKIAKAAEIACEGQKAANTATELAMLLGKQEAVVASSAVSAMLGAACLW